MKNSYCFKCGQRKGKIQCGYNEETGKPMYVSSCTNENCMYGTQKPDIITRAYDFIGDRILRKVFK